ncbi:hypothetical protein GGF46_000260 [Coemansia sp. RSA 552]|nr:hypothetical protein GGF46_000260 [Coemansia sp. RSA 552]
MHRSSKQATSSGLVSWSEVAGGLAVLVMLVAGLAFVAMAFLLATIGIGQLELRALVLLRSWYVAGPLLVLAATLVFLSRLRRACLAMHPDQPRYKASWL